MRPPTPWIVTAARPGQPPMQLRFYAHNRAHALETAQELFPGCLYSIPTPEPDWDTTPA